MSEAEHAAAGTFIRRVGAKGVDFLLLGVLWLLAGRVLARLVYGRFDYYGPEMQDNMAATVAWFNYAALMTAMRVVIGFAYHWYCLTRLAATLGKRALRLKVVRPDGGRLSAGQIIGRYFGEWLSRVTCGLGYLLALFDGQNRTLHDRLSGTRVVASSA